ncbi:hypothetical protein BDZ89DRAFT_1066394 [Hymenopellis radicata]|nr:hypothetical protein BDZ89DRAFT_1066394 [Hymenopellis radicata]
MRHNPTTTAVHLTQQRYLLPQTVPVAIVVLGLVVILVASSRSSRPGPGRRCVLCCFTETAAAGAAQSRGQKSTL